MNTPWFGRFLAALLAVATAALTVNLPAATQARQPPHASQSPLSHQALVNVRRDYGSLPLAFEPNVGQADPQVRFLARGGGMTAFFTDTETVMVLIRSMNLKLRNGARDRRPADGMERAVVRMKLENARHDHRAAGLEKVPGIANYFIGNDPAKWQTSVPRYGRIQYRDAYPGIDLVWYGNQRQLEYDFVVSPGADPKQIQVAYEGAESLAIDANGDLVLRTTLGEVRQRKPRVYQAIGGRQVEIAANYSITARNHVGFELANYDRKRQLRIDPVVLGYSTYLGGSGDDYGSGIAVDAAGAAYVTGFTFSADFPTQSPFQAQGQYVHFVTKLTPAGNAVAYSTFLGGTNIHTVLSQYSAIAVDSSGSAYVTGSTSSASFPTKSPYQMALVGPEGAEDDAFVTKLAPSGNALVYSTYLGGSGGDEGIGIAVDGAGSAYITGSTGSPNFPTKAAYQASKSGGTDTFVTKLTPTGNALVYSTYLGGSGSDVGTGIALDRSGSAYITGNTSSADFPTQSPYQAALGGVLAAFITKMTPAGDALIYSTYLGGGSLGKKAGGSQTNSGGIAVDGAGSAYLTGSTDASDFPTQSPYQATQRTPGVGEAFVTKLTSSGTALVYSTYLGGSLGSDGVGIQVDGAGSAYVLGNTGSADFPILSPYQGTLPPGGYAPFVTKLTSTGNALVYSTYLGGSLPYESGLYQSGTGIAVDATGAAYLIGDTSSTSFPTQSPFQATNRGGFDAFVSKLQPLAGAGGQPPGAITSFTPAQGATGFSVTTALTWSAATGAVSYDVYLGPTPTPPLVGNTTNLTFSPSALSPNTTYYWYLISKNAAGSTASAIWSFTTEAGSSHPALFSGEASLGSGIYYLQFPSGNLFGYYSYPSATIIYHFDLGYEGIVDAPPGAAYMYDFLSGHWIYTSATLFPYLYDFTLNDWLYYFPDTKNPGHYTNNPRYFSNLTTGKIITM